eukprot:3058821-Prymnesium_polylepis.1
MTTGVQPAGCDLISPTACSAAGEKAVPPPPCCRSRAPPWNVPYCRVTRALPLYCTTDTTSPAPCPFSKYIHTFLYAWLSCDLSLIHI